MIFSSVVQEVVFTAGKTEQTPRRAYRFDETGAVKLGFDPDPWEQSWRFW